MHEQSQYSKEQNIEMMVLRMGKYWSTSSIGNTAVVFADLNNFVK